jgi:hypothetical protein
LTIEDELDRKRFENALVYGYPTFKIKKEDLGWFVNSVI